MCAMESSVYGEDKGKPPRMTGRRQTFFAENPNDSTEIDKKVRIFLDNLSDKPIE
jgi:hypothetical protein